MPRFERLVLPGFLRLFHLPYAERKHVVVRDEAQPRGQPRETARIEFHNKEQNVPFLFGGRTLLKTVYESGLKDVKRLWGLRSWPQMNLSRLTCLPPVTGDTQHEITPNISPELACNGFKYMPDIGRDEKVDIHDREQCDERILVTGHLKHPNGRKDSLPVCRSICEAEDRVADFMIRFPSVFPGCKYKRPLFSHRASEDYDGEENRQYDAKRRCDGLYFTFCFQLQR